MAELESKRRHLPFLTAHAKMQDDYGISMTSDDFIEKGYSVWREIGNIAVDTKKLVATVQEDLIVQLPVECEFVDSVSTNAFRDVLGYSSGRKFDAEGRIPEHNESAYNKTSESLAKQGSQKVYGFIPNYSLGPNNTVILTNIAMAGQEVEVVYHTMITGEDGLPLLNDKEVKAIAMNVALRQAVKDFFITGQKKSEARVSYLEPKAELALAAAKIPEQLSTAFLDKALDVKSSWERKTFGNMFNPIS